MTAIAKLAAPVKVTLSVHKCTLATCACATSIGNIAVRPELISLGAICLVKQ